MWALHSLSQPPNEEWPGSHSPGLFPAVCMKQNPPYGFANISVCPVLNICLPVTATWQENWKQIFSLKTIHSETVGNWDTQGGYYKQLQATCYHIAIICAGIPHFIVLCRYCFLLFVVFFLSIYLSFTNWRFVATLHQGSLLGPFFPTAFAHFMSLSHFGNSHRI